MNKSAIYLFVVLISFAYPGNLFAQSNSFADFAPKKEKTANKKRIADRLTNTMLSTAAYDSQSDDTSAGKQEKALTSDLLNGSLEGYLSDCLSGDPIEGATIIVSNLSTTTTSGGYFYFDAIPVGSYDLFFSAAAFCPNPTAQMVAIFEGMTTYVEICLAPAQFEVFPASMSVVLEPNATSSELITLSNPGFCDVDWTASVFYPDKNAEDLFDVIMDVPVGVGSGIAGGLAIDDHISVGTHTFLGTAQNENISALELVDSVPNWLSLSANSGLVVAGQTGETNAILDAGGLLPGDYEATIYYITSPEVDSVQIEVSLTVVGIFPPINLSGSFDCTDVHLTWEMPNGGNPDSWNVYKDGNLLANVTEMMYTDAMVYPEVANSYTVTAVYDGEVSIPTPALLITVPTPENLEPVDPICIFFDSGFLITWEIPTTCLLPMGYNIYRDGTVLNSSLITSLQYFDEIEQGSYEYAVSAVYYFGESEPVVATCITGLEDHLQGGIEVYPNPVDSWLVVRSVWPLKALEVFTNYGTEIIKQEVSGTEALVDMSAYPRGLYFLKIKTGDKTLLKKVIVK